MPSPKGRLPRQLAMAKRPKRTMPRPLVETLQRLDINDLCRWKVFPDQYSWDKVHYLEAPFRFPFLKSLIFTLQYTEANHHNGYNQIIPLRWCRTGFGGNNRPRPLFICQCGRSVRRVYFKGGHLACRRCCDATYASRVCDKRTRPILQAKRLQNFLQLKSYMSKRNRRRLTARIATAPEQVLGHLSRLKSKRLAHHSIPLPQSNYRTRGAMHWR
jgi:hypothetical protein